MASEKTMVDLPPAPVSADAPLEHSFVLGAEPEKLPLLIVEPGASPPSDDQDSVLLQLGDLLPDSSGEVVLFMGEDVSVNLLTRETITRSEEHTSELQSLMRISYAVFCLKK